MSQSPDNLYDGALLLLRSWVACIESGDNNQRDIIANLMDDTRSLLRDEREREGNFFNAPESAAAAPVPAEQEQISKLVKLNRLQRASLREWQKQAERIGNLLGCSSVDIEERIKQVAPASAPQGDAEKVTPTDEEG